jgi:hypothetical protein
VEGLKDASAIIQDSHDVSDSDKAGHPTAAAVSQTRGVQARAAKNVVDPPSTHDQIADACQVDVSDVHA